MSNLIVHNLPPFSVTVSASAKALIEEAQASASAVTSVHSAETNETAVAAQMLCARVLKLVEDSRKLAKAPVIDAGRAIDAAARQAVALVEAEQLRLTQLIGDFQQSELARARSAQAALSEELSALERDREEQLAQAESLDEREQIRADYSELARELQPPAPVKAEGQTVSEVWCFEVENPMLLANSHPTLVRIEPKRREITEALKMGLKVHGVKAWKEIRAGVRLEREPNALTI